jgi:predicted nucleotidyltransferase
LHERQERELIEHPDMMLRDEPLDTLPPPVMRLIHQLAARPEVRSIRLFGSRALGDAGPRSDVDLAIEAPDASRRQWIDITLMVEDAETLLSIDLVRLEEASPALRERILSEGVILYA